MTPEERALLKSLIMLWHFDLSAVARELGTTKEALMTTMNTEQLISFWWEGREQMKLKNDFNDWEIRGREI